MWLAIMIFSLVMICEMAGSLIEIIQGVEEFGPAEIFATIVVGSAMIGPRVLFHGFSAVAFYFSGFVPTSSWEDKYPY